MRSRTDGAVVGSYRRMGWAVPLAVIAGAALASGAQADRFQIRQSLATETNASMTSKQRNEPIRVLAGRLTANGVAVFVAGNQKEESAAVTLDGGFQGAADNLRSLYTQVLTFADNSSIKLYLDGSSKGTKFSATIVGAEGSGRFKGIQVRGTLTGTVLDPALNYGEIQGEYTMP